MTSHDGNLEARLRDALSARALSVTAGDLQPGVPPTVAGARRLRRLPWRWPRLLTGAALAGVTAVAAVAAVALLRGDDEGPAPAPNPPAATVPSESPAPSPSAVPASPAVPVTPQPGSSTVPGSPEPEATRGRDGAPKGIPATPDAPAATATPSAPVTTSQAAPDGPPSPPPGFG